VAAARAALADQQARIGRVDVATSVPAALELDGVEVGHTPLPAPLRAAEGLHTLAALADGCLPVRREIRVAGGATERVSFTLVPAQAAASLTITASVADAEALVDGVPVGRTPLAASLPVAPGTHDVVLRRAGYHEARRSIALAAGATGALALTLDEDAAAPASARGFLLVSLSEPEVTLSIDGRSHGPFRGGRLELPLGPHRLRAERAGFVTAEEDVTVRAGADSQARVTLQPTAETYAAYTSGARRQRTWGWVAAAGGVAIAAASGALVWHYTNAANDAQRTADAFEAKRQMVLNAGQDCDATLGGAVSSYCDNTSAANFDRLNAAENRRRLAWAGVGVGAAAAALGGYLLFTADDPHRYDRAASASAWLGARGGGLLVQGRF